MNDIDTIINRSLIYGDHPVSGLYFTVVVQYNTDHPMCAGLQKGTTLVSNPLKTFSDALDASDKIAQSLVENQLKNTNITDVDPVTSNGFHYYLMDQEKNPVARIMIDTHDVRNVTIH